MVSVSIGVGVCAHQGAGISDAVEYLFDEVAALHADGTTRGVAPETTLKELGVDTLPTGVLLSGNTLRVKQPATLDGWLIKNVKTILESGTSLSLNQCVIVDDGSVNHGGRIIDPYVGSAIGDIRNSSFVGPGYFGNVAANKVIACRTSGGGATTEGVNIDVIEYCEFIGWSSDIIVTTGSGLIRRNYFDAGVNLLPGTAPWDAGTTYSVGDMVVNNTDPYETAFISLADGNIGNALPSEKQSNAFWQNTDPHVDNINPQSQADPDNPLIIEENFFNRSETIRSIAPAEIRCVGQNNAIRAVTNAGGQGSDDAMHQVIIRNNIITAGAPRNAGLPIALNVLSEAEPFKTPSTVSGNWIGATIGGLIIRPEEVSGHVFAENDETYLAPLTSGAGYNGPDIS